MLVLAENEDRITGFIDRTGQADSEMIVTPPAPPHARRQGVCHTEQRTASANGSLVPVPGYRCWYLR